MSTQIFMLYLGALSMIINSVASAGWIESSEDIRMTCLVVANIWIAGAVIVAEMKK